MLETSIVNLEESNTKSSNTFQKLFTQQLNLTNIEESVILSEKNCNDTFLNIGIHGYNSNKKKKTAIVGNFVKFKKRKRNSQISHNTSLTPHNPRVTFAEDTDGNLEFYAHGMSSTKQRATFNKQDYQENLKKILSDPSCPKTPNKNFDWKEISNIFNQRNATSYSKDQIANFYYNSVKLSKINKLNSQINAAFSEPVQELNLITNDVNVNDLDDTINFDQIIYNSNDSNKDNVSDNDTNSSIVPISKIDYDVIRNTQLDFSTGEMSSTESSLLLEIINTNLKSKITTSTGNRLKWSRIQRRYEYLAKSKKLENSSLIFYNRSPKQLEEHYKYLLKKQKNK